MSDLVGSTAEAALRAGEEQWRSAFEASGFGAWLADHNHRFLSTNATFQAMLGYTREELRRLSPLDVAAEDEREACRALLLELQQGARRSFEATIKCERRDRSLIVVSHHVSAIQGSDGSPPRFIATTVDITARKQAEHALRTTRSELGRAAQLTAMGVMTASIAHDINQPLAVVTTAGNAAMRWLDRTPFDVQSARASLRRVIGNGHRAGVMIDNARAVFKRDEKEKTPLDVNSVIREVLGLVRGELQDHGVSAESELAEGLPQVSANRLQLQVLMLNLLENAADAMGSASRRPRSSCG